MMTEYTVIFLPGGMDLAVPEVMAFLELTSLPQFQKRYIACLDFREEDSHG